MNTGRDFVDEEGDVRHLSDFDENLMEWEEAQEPGHPLEVIQPDTDDHVAATALAKLARKPSRRNRVEPIDGRMLGSAIENRIADLEIANGGQPLSEAEIREVSHAVELQLRGL